MAHFFAVAVTQSSRSPPFLRIQDEHGPLLTVFRREHKTHG
jgi:hypothetical protein